MTSKTLLESLTPLVEDLSRELPQHERFRRLLSAMRDLIPCDASAILRLEGDVLVPLAIDGLSTDTLGRRFRLAEHPRFRALLEAVAPMQFPTDCELPDPYDGLVDGAAAVLEVHDCMGCVLQVDEHPWGLLTLDALSAGRFTALDLERLRAFASLAAATVKVSERIQRLTLQAKAEHDRAESYRAAQPAGRALIGQSRAARQLLQDIKVVGDSDLTVLITGETGVGKELVAQALHVASRRAAKPMVTVNCAALPEALVESELFGHVRGAFSGAVAERRGKFEMADGGTLFLDEVGELPMNVQAKLLRVLQSGQLQRVGSDREHRVDVRLIAATNRDLTEEIRAGRYRADLYHRLSVYPLYVPALREREQDVLLISGAFLEENRSRLALSALRLAPDARAALLAYDWPGNVRELEHLIGRSVLKTLGRLQERPKMLSLVAADLDLPAMADAASRRAGFRASGLQGGNEPNSGHNASDAANTRMTASAGERNLRNAVEALERTMITSALQRHCENWSAAARELGMDRANLARMAKRLGLNGA